MSTINELYLEIEDLDKKIEEEPRRRLKRKLMIEDEIKRLEEEKRRSGLHGDFQSVQQFNTQIKRLQHESTGGNVYEYESEVKVLKHKLLNLLLDYYKEGHDIEDIFKIEDVSQDIQDTWLNKCNFGKTSGLLFLDEIENEDVNNWRYYNPIFDIEYKSRTLDDLEYQIKSHDEVYFIFNDDLINNSQNRDLKLYQTKIDEYLTDLKDCEDASDIFDNLKEYKDKFSKKQIMDLTEYFLEDDANYELVVEFKDIIETNSDKLDTDTLNKIYQDIIDEGIKRLNNPSRYHEYIYTQHYFMNDLLDCLKKFANKFNENQIINLCNFLIDKVENYGYFYDIDYILENYDDFNFLNKIRQDIIDDGIKKVAVSDAYQLTDVFTCLKEYSDYFTKSQIIGLNDAIEDYKYYRDFFTILNKNKDKFEENELNEFYNNIIDNGIARLDNSAYSSNHQIFSYLNLISDKFSRSQIEKLYEYILEDIDYYDDFNQILQDNSDKFDLEELDEIYSGLIDNGISELKNPNIDQDEIHDVLNYLNSYSLKFSSEQLNKLCDIVTEDIYGFNENFISILEDNGDNFDKVYKNIINQRINILKGLDSQNTSSKYLIKDLRYLANSFNKNQLTKLTEIIISNPNICNFANDFKYILSSNDEENDATYEKIIESRINSLTNADSRAYPCLFKDLNTYANQFNKNQINTFYNIIKDEKYMSCCGEDIIQILSKNKNNLDEDYQDIIIEMRINVKLDKLNNIAFGYRDARLILEDLDDYADNFTNSQLVRLCNISLTNDQVYKCDYCKTSLNRILSANKDRINSELYEEVVLKNGL